ncbi:hypothetical protein PSN45_004988 [Yamadazyma tenuis]|uniref:RING-type domain-containing protein n=1 Tax=Candida tenuis (strain ATCC 10573 / BCRC 21748 / CBS 615 / JCM 9827 / NBRC 10315 / NRRL Y-1498 / VKM Y-70) TaxID=590646 RepID=G3B2D7_CANTC|nr:uncharacterized protein CANTEDRAFT_129872 [Yamadazyma tenuis ATCC 10573]EGV64649.1 hypothetical protein CANTEDRAFT_129872 [Yamadazyma tenuis ATCC 10573]WEJ97437.1 hypothetical protein PSN45_004988 [Yamadazyma tenuis]
MSDPDPHEECTICLELLIPTSRLGVVRDCRHYYHDTCIVQWSNNSNSCPTCRNLFNDIDIKVSNSPHIIETVHVQDKLLANDAINDIPSEYIIPANQIIPSTNEELQPLDTQRHGVCSICSSSDYRTSLTRNMVTCQACNSKFHQTCLSHSDYDSGWYCPICDCRQEMVVSPALYRRRQPVSRRRVSANGVIRHIINTSSRRRQPIPEPTGFYDDDRDIDDTETYTNNDDFMDTEDDLFDSQSVHYSPPVVNGGSIARREIRQLQSLTPEELKSWELFDQAKDGNTPAVLDSMQNNNTPTRRRRKKRTLPETLPQTSGDTHPERPLGPGSSRISSLMNQIKTSSPPHNSSFHTASREPVVEYSSSYSGSPSGGSPSSSNFSPVTSGDEDSSSVKAPVLSYDQKSRIQKFIRDRLRPLYKKNTNNEVKLIRSEDDYIKINRSASRKIYGRITSMAQTDNQVMDSLFGDDERNLQTLVQDYINNEINEYSR